MLRYFDTHHLEALVDLENFETLHGDSGESHMEDVVGVTIKQRVDP